jgi:tetratricopeptide (TPR) repeat protein
VNPRNEDALFKTAQFQLFVKDYKAAEGNFLTLIQINNGKPDAFFFLGTVYKEMNDTLKALRQFQNAVAADPEYYNAYIQLGNLYSDKNDPEGIAYFSNAIRIDEFSDEAYYGRGFLYQKLEKYKEAVADYQKTVELNPTHKFAYYNTGSINAILGKQDKALEQFTTAIKFAPDFDKAYNRIAQIMEMQGDKAAARINYEKCLEINPNFVLAKEGLARINNEQP